MNTFALVVTLSTTLITRATFNKHNFPTRISKFVRHIKMSTLSVQDSITDLPLDNLVFDNRNLQKLPLDKGERRISRQVSNAIFAEVDLQPVQNPSLICTSPEALQLLGLPLKQQSEYSTTDIKKLTDYLSGSKLIPGSQPAAHCYCGHQFGSFAGQLGDGAAMYLGETISTTGKTDTGLDITERWELQLKGSGLTPFSRTADGRKVLRSSIREFLASEAMYYLNIPTTRSGSVITSDTTVERDPYYDGNNIHEKCTIITRIAPNFFRFGSFEIFKQSTTPGYRSGPSANNNILKKLLIDHILSYYPELTCNSTQSSSSNTEGNTEVYEALYKEIMIRTIKLVAKWQSVGFVHGVLNTDNMSIMGLTIDYGPYGFMEHFDPDYTPNGSDNSGRYSYTQQPSMCKWNLQKLAEALDPYVPLNYSMTLLNDPIHGYDTLYEQEYHKLMYGKLGLVSPSQYSNFQTNTINNMIEVKTLLTSLLTAMTETYIDYTDTFIILTDMIDMMESKVVSDDEIMQITLNKLLSRCASAEELINLLQRKLRIHRLGMHPSQLLPLLQLLEENPDEVSSMFGDAPIEAIRAELMAEKRKFDKLSTTAQLIKTLKNEMNSTDTTSSSSRSSSYSTKMKQQHEAIWKEWLQSYLTHIKLLKSSPNSNNNNNEIEKSITQMMKQLNPTFILRNWIAQETITAAEKNDYSKVQTVLHMLKTPYNENYNVFGTQKNMLYGECSIDTITTAKADSRTPDSGTRTLTTAEQEFIRIPPTWADGLLCTCSS